MLHARAILFDIDGTLVDSSPVVERSWRAWAREYGVDAEEVLRVCHGRRTQDTVAEFVTPQQLAVAVARLQALELADFDGVTALPGAQELLDVLPPRRWAAVTSGERDLMAGRLSAAKLPIPETMICAEDVAVGKPSPEGYLQAAAALGFVARQCVVIEDAPAGIAAGLAAGARVVAVTTTHTAHQVANADVIVADLSCLRARLTDDGVALNGREVR
ncbi:MAG: mannitol-/sugar-/sorbitol-6-phosphatase [Mycobacterium sp.]|nr:mannitol-/sugar-/sorbitol-6-phosphatase [Mycobacterium sp.]